MSAFSRTGKRQPHYFLWALLLVAVCLSVGSIIDVRHIAVLSEITANKTLLYAWRLMAYVALLIAWPLLLNAIKRRKSEKDQWSKRRYLLVVMLLYEMLIVANPLKQLFEWTA